MTFLLKVSGLSSSLILLFTGFQITSIPIDLELSPKQQAQEEALFKYTGTVLIGLGCFTGPLLFGISSIVSEIKENSIDIRSETERDKNIH